jgi:hypothetical protein
MRLDTALFFCPNVGALLFAGAIDRLRERFDRAGAAAMMECWSLCRPILKVDEVEETDISTA